MVSNIQIIKTQILPILNERDVVTIRRTVREWAIEAQFSLLYQTKIMTAASELARNVVSYAGTGSVQLQLITNDQRQGLKLIFEDKGPGIADIALALKDGYSTGGSLGMGLSGAKRLVNYFDIQSQPGVGTTVAVILWR